MNTGTETKIVTETEIATEIWTLERDRFIAEA